MRRYVVGLALMALAVPATGQEPDEERRVEPEAPAPSFGFETDFSSRYTWRGLALSEGAVQQTSAWISKGPFTFTLWSNFVIGNGPNQGKFDEVDLTVGYSQEGKGFTLAPSINIYLYPQGNANHTAELSFKLSRPLGAAQLFTSQSVDFVEGEGAYFGEVGIERAREVGKNLTLAGQLSVGWASEKFNNYNIGLSHAGLQVVGGQMSLTYQAKGFTVRPHVGLSALIGKSVRDGVDEPTLFSAGIAIGKSW